MKISSALSLILAITVLAGCATPSIPLKPSSYDKGVTTTSNLTAKVIHLSGVVSGASDMSMVPIGSGMFLPISSGPHPHLQFNDEDQRIFLTAFRQELERLHLVKSAIADPKQTADIEIKVMFAQTFHNPIHQEYILDVGMQITYSAGKTFTNRYRIISNEGDSWFEKMNTNASEGKAKAGDKLMAALVSDVEKWLVTK